MKFLQDCTSRGFLSFTNIEPYLMQQYEIVQYEIVLLRNLGFVSTVIICWQVKLFHDDPTMAADPRL